MSCADTAQTQTVCFHCLSSRSCSFILLHQVEELEAEVESANRLASRFKSRLAVAQDEVSGLEDSLQRERQQVARLRQQLTEAQAQAQPSRLLSIQATPSYWAGVPESDMEAGHAQLRKLQQQVSDAHTLLRRGDSHSGFSLQV